MIPLRNSIKSHISIQLSKVFLQYFSSVQNIQQSLPIKEINNKSNVQKLGEKCLTKVSTLSSIKRVNISHYSCSKNVKYLFSQTKQQKSTQNIRSSHLSTILSEPKEHQFILNLFTSFQKQSQILNSNFQANPNFMNSQEFTKILTSLNTLSQSINLFLLELQIQQMSEIDRWKWSGEAWSGKLKQHRQNILIEIQQRKLFFKRLQNFLSNVTKQLEVLFHSQIVRQKDLQKKKQNLQVKNNSKLVQGDFFKHSFLTENYQEIYDQVKESKEEYLLKSRKLKSFSLLKVNDYESNYALKLRFMIQILSQIKHIYQIFLLNQSKKLNLKEIEQNFTSLNNFLSQTVISPDQYEDLIKAYSNQFSQESIKNFMFMSVGYHSPEISQLNKQLVDVKIKETIFDFDIETLCNLYLIKQNQWLYNLQGSDFQPNLPLNGSKNDQKRLQQQNQQQMRKYSKFFNNKQIILKYAKVILKELHKIKKQEINHQKQLQNNSFQNENSSLDQIIQNSSYSQQKVSFNQILPYNFFNITDVIRLQSLIQQEIIPLMVNPDSAYQSLVRKKLKKLKQSSDQKTKRLIESEYLQNLNKLLHDNDSNMYFISRFYEWSFHMIVHIKNFLNLFYQTQKENIQHELYLLLDDKFSSQQIHTPYLIIFFRMLNVLYNANNRINPIYIEDFISTTEIMTQKFTQMIELNICQKLSISPVQLLEVFDKILLKMIRKNKETTDGISASLFRFRVFSAFLDNKVINASQLFQILINPQVIQSFASKGQDLKRNIILGFLFYSDGLQKCLQIYSQFYFNQKAQFFELLQRQPYFSQFSSVILSYQKNFNGVLNCLQFYQETQMNQANNHKKNDKIQKSKDQIPSLLQFYEKNDLIHRSQFSDQQIYISWLNKTLQNSNGDLQKFKKDLNLIDQQNKYIQSFVDFENPLKILRILSQNTTFLASSMNLTYFGYTKLLIQEMHAFEGFQLSWNYPFYSDVAIGKSRIRGKKHTKQSLYIQTLATSGIQGRGRFFKEQTSLKRNFMNFIDLSQKGKNSNLIPIQTKRYFYGLRAQDNSIILIKIPIGKSQQLLHTVREWMQDRFHLLDKVRSNRYEPQQFK